jgi:hypothetical protein
MARRAKSKTEAVEEAVNEEICPPTEGTGGSAMPCGLVLPAARAKLVEGDWEPEVLPVALSK